MPALLQPQGIDLGYCIQAPLRMQLCHSHRYCTGLQHQGASHLLLDTRMLLVQAHQGQLLWSTYFTSGAMSFLDTDQHVKL